MAILRRDRQIPPDVVAAAKAAGFKKPDIYAGSLVFKRRSPKVRSGKRR